MTDIINNITNQQWFITIVSFLAANFLAIIGCVVKILFDKAKLNRINNAFQEKLVELEEHMNEEQKAKIEELKKEADEKINLYKNMLNEFYQKALANLSDEKKLKIEENANRFQELVLNALDDLNEEEPEEENDNEIGAD